MAGAISLIALAAGHAHAGILQITVSEGATSYLILDEGPLDTLVAPPPSNINKIQALAAALVFPDYKIVGLNATTNDPGSTDPGIGANLTIGGEVQKLDAGFAGPSASPLIITATDTDYSLPAGGRVLYSSMSTTDTAVPAGDTRTFESWYNPTNVPYATDVPQGVPVPLSYASTGLPPNSNGQTAAPVGVPLASLYGLTNTTVITMTGANADMIFGGTTVVLVPEPGALIMIALFGVVLLAAGRSRRRRTALF
jgi:hypothetical protein